MKARRPHRYTVTMQLECDKEGDCVVISRILFRLLESVKEIKISELNVQKIITERS